MKYLVLFPCLMLFAFQSIYAQQLNEDQLMNHAAQLQVYSQSMVKAYVAIGFGAGKEFHEQEIKKIEENFDKKLAALRLQASDDMTANTMLREIELLWPGFTSFVKTKKDKAQYGNLLIKQQELNNSITKYINHLSEESDSKISQNMKDLHQISVLSQTLTTQFLAVLWQIEDENLNLQLNSTITKFESSLMELLNSVEQTNYEKVAALVPHWKIMEDVVTDMSNVNKFTGKQLNRVIRSNSLISQEVENIAKNMTKIETSASAE